jgi:uncharacterized protein (DUF2235 family)
MTKNIVFCADGTWNHPHNPAMVEEADTNVYKLSQMIENSSAQRVFYDDGVGADGLAISRLLGGAFGEGLFQKVKEGYTAIAHVYKPGDRIFIFGFSRGAFTARSVSGMITACGLPTNGFHPRLVETAFSAYRDRERRAAILATLGEFGLQVPRIQMLGVWDTVGALGIPGALFGLEDQRYGFLNTSLSPNVLNAFHALAIDERRREFQPTLWISPPTEGQTMEQIWFTGVHCDVGGGYADCGLSQITLSWMLKHAIALGIKPISEAVQESLGIDAADQIDPKHALAPTHESWNVLWLMPERRAVPNGSKLGNSVEVRLENEHTYRPPKLTYGADGKLSGYTLVPVVGNLTHPAGGAGS